MPAWQWLLDAAGVLLLLALLYGIALIVRRRVLSHDIDVEQARADLEAAEADSEDEGADARARRAEARIRAVEKAS